MTVSCVKIKVLRMRRAGLYDLQSTWLTLVFPRTIASPQINSWGVRGVSAGHDLAYKSGVNWESIAFVSFEQCPPSPKQVQTVNSRPDFLMSQSSNRCLQHRL